MKNSSETEFEEKKTIAGRSSVMGYRVDNKHEWIITPIVLHKTLRHNFQSQRNCTTQIYKINPLYFINHAARIRMV